MLHCPDLVTIRRLLLVMDTFRAKWYLKEQERVTLIRNWEFPFKLHKLFGITPFLHVAIV